MFDQNSATIDAAVVAIVNAEDPNRRRHHDLADRVLAQQKQKLAYEMQMADKVRMLC